MGPVLAPQDLVRTALEVQDKRVQWLLAVEMVWEWEPLLELVILPHSRSRSETSRNEEYPKDSKEATRHMDKA